MIANLKCSALLLSLVAPIFLSGCASDTGVSQAEYDSVVAENQQLRQQSALDQDHIKRLQSAIKYTVNSDLLFPPGGYELSDAGKDIIAKMARVLAPHQQEKLVVNGYTDDAPVGATLQSEGVDFEPSPVGDARRCREEVYDLTRREAGICQCKGMGRG